MRRSVTATYRLQVHREFPLAEIRALVPYFHDLGVSHLYLSPILAARSGSTHGYDVVDPARLNPEVGSDADLHGLADALHARGMGIILDIVPNHMAAIAQNRYWDDVLERGAASRYADWFDIDWQAPAAKGKVILPVLGDDFDAVLERGELKLQIRDSGARVAYFDKTFPLDPATLPREVQLAQLDPAARPAADEWASGVDGRARLRALLEAQHYRLTFWRRTRQELNYRRFFEINDLVAIRMESESVFEQTHTLILEWVQAGILDGLRVDHVDGLRLPAWYLARLRTAVDGAKSAEAPERFPIFVEKILAGHESLPHDWPVDGTTGYDFLNELEDLFLEPEGYRTIEARYRRLRRNPDLRFHELAHDSKRQLLKDAFAPDVRRVARAARAWRSGPTVDAYAGAIIEVIVHLAVYRTYVAEPGVVTPDDRRELTAAFRGARARDVDSRALRTLEEAFFAAPDAADAARRELVLRFQQTSGPAMAKGVEDTALYVYVPLAARNEVGGEPDRTLDDAVERLHARNAMRARDWPRGMIATNTHDTKRSADVRSRLDALTLCPDRWARHVERWRRLNRQHKETVNGRPAPDTNSEYLYYQTLVGLWPAPRRDRRADDLPDRTWRAGARERLLGYMLKAAREAKLNTSWTERDAAYERALQAFVRATLEAHEDAPFLPDVSRLTAAIAHDGFRNALARITVHFTAPGFPDLYQGSEGWTFSLVDPDNRRPVDFDRRAQLLRDREPHAVLRDALRPDATLGDDRIKLALVATLLRFRRDHVALVRDGEYAPLLEDVNDLFAFARRHGGEACLVVARLRPDRNETSQSVTLPGELAGRWRSMLTGRDIELRRGGDATSTSLPELIPSGQPSELLYRTNG